MIQSICDDNEDNDDDMLTCIRYSALTSDNHSKRTLRIVSVKSRWTSEKLGCVVVWSATDNDEEEDDDDDEDDDDEEETVW